MYGGVYGTFEWLVGRRGKVVATKSNKLTCHDGAFFETRKL